MLNEPTREEILRWRERLEDREFQRRLLRFQNHVYQVFEDLRRQTGLELIRTVLRRDEVKSLDSIVEKILRKRMEQSPEEEPYGFDNLQDFIGIKIICPYQNDVESVIKYLYRQSGVFFRVLEPSAESARRESSLGYRGYHFTVYPSEGAPAGWTPLFCEVQIKTMIQEAFDAKSHDMTYKPKGQIPQTLLAMFANLGDSLAVAEKQGELIRQEIEKLYTEEQNHRYLAAKSLFEYSLKALAQMSEGYPELPTIQDEQRLTPRQISLINEALRCERSAGRLHSNACRLAAYIALSQREPGEQPDPEQIAFALQLANELVERTANDPRAELIRAEINWAFSRYSQAIQYAEWACDKSEQSDLPAALKARIYGDSCYYIADAAVLQRYVPQKNLEVARQKANDLKTLWNHQQEKTEWLAMADNIGFVKIALGQNEGEVREGIALVQEVLGLIYQQDNSDLQKVAEAFCRHHLYLGDKKLRELRIV